MAVDIGKVLRRLRTEERGLTLFELSEAIGEAINPSTLSKMETKNLTITPEYLKVLADFYGITMADIIREAEGGSAADPSIINAKRIPLITWRDLSHWPNSEQRTRIFSESQKTIALPPASDKSFAITVSGNSMQTESGDSFPEGFLLIVEPTDNYSSGSYVIALPQGGIGLFRQLVIEGDEKYLRPLNSNYQTQLLKEGTAIIGTVIKATWSKPVQQKE